MKVPVFYKIICIIMVVMLGASTAFGVMNYLGQDKIKAQVQKLNDAADAVDPAQEDDVKICRQYEIKSTKHISDAYISGDTSALNDRDKETLDMAKAILDEHIKPEMISYEKEYEIYKFLISELKFDNGVLNVISTSEKDSDNPYGVLKNRNAVCVGYATTFRLFMQMLKIECMVVHSSDCTHTWNLVKLENEWYHVDCYLDQSEGSYMNFNMNDYLCSQGHIWNREFFPAASGIKYNLAIINSVELENVYSLPEFFKENAEKEALSFSCTFKEKLDEKGERLAAYMTDGIMNRLNVLDDRYYTTYWNKKENGELVLCVYLTIYGNGDYGLDEEAKESVNEAISEFFPEYEDDYYGYYDGGYYGEAKG